MKPIPNYDAIAGIHYGVISQHSLNADALGEIFEDSRDLSYEAAIKEAQHSIMVALDLHTDEERKNRLMKVLGDFVRDSRIDVRMTDILDLDEDPRHISREAAWEVVEEDFNDNYQNDYGYSWLYESDGYVLRDCLDSDIMVIKAPFYTWAAQCSPCVPNAGNLDSPRPQGDGLKSYCLGPDWFDKIHYEPFNVPDAQNVP